MYLMSGRLVQLFLIFALCAVLAQSATTEQVDAVSKIRSSGKLSKKDTVTANKIINADDEGVQNEFTGKANTFDSAVQDFIAKNQDTSKSGKRTRDPHAGPSHSHAGHSHDHDHDHSSHDHDHDHHGHGHGHKHEHKGHGKAKSGGKKNKRKHRQGNEF